MCVSASTKIFSIAVHTFIFLPYFFISVDIFVSLVILGVMCHYLDHQKYRFQIDVPLYIDVQISSGLEVILVFGFTKFGVL